MDVDEGQLAPAHEAPADPSANERHNDVQEENTADMTDINNLESRGGASGSASRSGATGASGPGRSTATGPEGRIPTHEVPNMLNERIDTTALVMAYEQAPHIVQCYDKVLKAAAEGRQEQVLATLETAVAGRVADLNAKLQAEAGQGNAKRARAGVSSLEEGALTARDEMLEDDALAAAFDLGQLTSLVATSQPVVLRLCVVIPGKHSEPHAVEFGKQFNSFMHEQCAALQAACTMEQHSVLLPGWKYYTEEMITVQGLAAHDLVYLILSRIKCDQQIDFLKPPPVVSKVLRHSSIIPFALSKAEYPKSVQLESGTVRFDVSWPEGMLVAVMRQGKPELEIFSPSTVRAHGTLFKLTMSTAANRGMAAAGVPQEVFRFTAADQTFYQSRKTGQLSFPLGPGAFKPIVTGYMHMHRLFRLENWPGMQQDSKAFTKGAGSVGVIGAQGVNIFFTQMGGPTTPCLLSTTFSFEGGNQDMITLANLDSKIKGWCVADLCSSALRCGEQCPRLDCSLKHASPKGGQTPFKKSECGALISLAQQAAVQGSLALQASAPPAKHLQLAKAVAAFVERRGSTAAEAGMSNLQVSQ